MVDEFAGIRAAVERLRLSPHPGRVFGADLHHFHLYPVLTDDRVADFEDRYRFRLPHEYRRFLTEVGNGGAGPFYGLFPLGMVDKGVGHAPWERADWLVGDPAATFPHADRWDSEFDPSVEDVSEEEWAIAEAANWSPALVGGAVPICHAGCSLRYWIVVTGPLAGDIWYDARVDWGGFSPVRVDGRRLSFLPWYRRWLEEAARVAEGSGIPG